jgi:NAD(P)H-dependent FMN reductase
VKKNILAISGSTRLHSTNLNVINAFVDLTSDIFNVEVFVGISELPHFNPDLDNETVSNHVSNFRELLRHADGVLICTPEYAMGVPGTLKNAIDWTVSSCEFNKKPTALITASTMGQSGHNSLLETLKIIDATISNETQLLISLPKTKITSDNKIINEETFLEMQQLISAFDKLISSK